MAKKKEEKVTEVEETKTPEEMLADLKAVSDEEAAADVILSEEKDLDSSAEPQNDKEEVTEPEEPKKKVAPKAAHEKKIVLTPKKYQHGKKYRAIEAEIERGKEYSVEEAIALVKKTATTKFDSTVEVHVNLNVDPSNADHQIRGSVLMPGGLGKNKRVCAVVNADKEKEAKDAGAETVGGADVIAKIEKGWLDFDILVATPDMMAQLGKLGKILGTKGLMPNPKTGTVTPEPGKVIAEIKKGRAEYKIDKAGNLHAAVGRVSFDDAKLKENIDAFLDVIVHSKPAALKGTFIQSIYLTSTMGPSVKLEK